MILALSLFFVGVKNFRDKYNNGVVSFGKAFKIGLYITIVASIMYVLAWIIDYYIFIPDFMDKYSRHVISQAQTSGASTGVIAAKTKDINNMRDMYRNPLMLVLLTYMEIFLVGLVISIITALTLKRKVNQAIVLPAT